MKDVKYNRSVTNAGGRPAIPARELPRDWKREDDASPATVAEILGILLAFALIVWAPAIYRIGESILKGVAR